MILRAAASRVVIAAGEVVDGGDVHVVFAQDLAAQAHLPVEAAIGETIPFGDGYGIRFAATKGNATGGAFGIAAATVENIHAAIFECKNEAFAFRCFDGAAVVECNGGHTNVFRGLLLLVDSL